MPTVHPRYTVTDTGDVRDMLDTAQRVWPDTTDRRQLLLRLAQAGHAAVVREIAIDDLIEHRRRQRAALARARTLVDQDLLDADLAWG